MDISKPRTSEPSPARALACLCLGALFSLAAIGCKKEPEHSTVLAQVGTSSLTLEDLRESFPAEFEQLIRREQYLDFIKRWMDDEVVYQQALKSKIDADPVVKRKLDKLMRKVLIEEFLAREHAAEVFEPDEIAMNQYYEMHKEDFRRKAPEVKFAQIRAQSLKQAQELRYKANRGDFLEVAAAGSLDPVPESYASIAFKKLNETPPCLSRQIADADIGGTMLPIACPDGFYVIKVMERQDAGSLIPFAEAREEISGILTMDRKDNLLEGRIAKYKENVSVSYNLDQIPGLSVALKTAPAPAAAGAVPVSPPASKPGSVSASGPVPGPASASRPAAVPPQPAASVSRPAAAAPGTAAVPVENRIPREPPAADARISKDPVSAAVPPAAAPDPRLPREPWQDKPETPPVKAKPPAKKRPAPVADTNAIKPGDQFPEDEQNQENPGSEPGE